MPLSKRILAFDIVTHRKHADSFAHYRYIHKHPRKLSGLPRSLKAVLLEEFLS